MTLKTLSPINDFLDDAQPAINIRTIDNKMIQLGLHNIIYTLRSPGQFLWFDLLLVNYKLTGV